MHLLFRETHALDENAQVVDLGHGPADLVVMSFSDADLGALAAQSSTPWSLRLAPLAKLRHPFSVDLYTESTIAHARCVVVRLLGGLDYWRYGAEQVAALCRQYHIPLAVLPGDGRPDGTLAEMSTIAADAYARLETCFHHGGSANMWRALALMAALGRLAPDTGELATTVPQHGVHSLDLDDRALAAVVFYRSHLLSADIAPMEALSDALRSRGLAVGTLFVGSLKAAETAAWVSRTLAAWQPRVVLNATGFSARSPGPTGTTASPLDAAGVPVLQLVLAGTSREAWQASSRGLAPADLAMQVVLPELDGRLLTSAISFKREQADRTVHHPEPGGIALAADRAAGWAKLAATRRADRRVAVMLSDYPGEAGRQGHAVGLDTFASLSRITHLLAQSGYKTSPATAASLTRALCLSTPTPFLSLADYERLSDTLPLALKQAANAAWGDPGDDAAVAQGYFTARHLRLGHLCLLIQPDRGHTGDRRALYHSPDLPPRHAYIAIYLWLCETCEALIHLGTHGSTEWLPGKAAALSADCWPRALLGGMPVIYPFIVNNPGEAAAAKRRLGAVTIGHLTPPLRSAGLHGDTEALEHLIDEYAAADGLDTRRTGMLRGAILEAATTAGLLDESGVKPDTPDDDALARLDAYLCDVKDLQIRDGLHVYGAQPDPARLALLPSGAFACAEAERTALLTALDGGFVAPGPAGAPSAGRMDVLPTGRNLAGIDPRSMPTRSAMVLAEQAANELLTRYRQDHGEWPRSIMLNVWGSAAMRTGGEDIGLALLLLGVRPLWDEGSSRVNGFTVTPLAELDRPRIDVTLRISGLFRDAFAAQVTLFAAAAAAVAARDEAADWNPLAGYPGVRVFGPALGQYGVKGDWLANSATGYGQTGDGALDPAALAERVRRSDAFLHVQDHAETDVLDGPEYAAHLAGFAAAAAALGTRPALYHHDGQMRSLAQQVRRVVRGRAANPAWIAGMMRHGWSGGAEMARAVDALAAFAAQLPERFDRQFDLLHDALVRCPEVDAFLRTENPDAHAAVAARFAAVHAASLWHPRRNAVAA